MNLKKQQSLIIISTVLVLLIANWFPGYSQSTGSDWLIKKSNPNDTIWCIIKERDNRHLTYTLDKAAFRVSISELSHYGLSSFKDSVFTPEVAVGDSNSATGENQKPMLSLYTVWDNSSGKPGKRLEWKHTLPYLKTDQQAMNHVTAARVFGVLKTVSCLLTFTFGIKMVIDEEHTNPTYLVVPFASTFVFHFCQVHQVKTAVRTYNKNAGYGYKDGLEK